MRLLEARCGLVLVPLWALVAMGCGGGDTTIIKKTLEEESASSASGEAFITDVVGGRRSAQPSSFSFSVNGDLIAEDLRWHDWGEPTATATGQFSLRDYPSQRRVTVRGEVSASGLAPCGGSSYYTRASITLPPRAPFQPQAVRLTTPCE